MSKNEFYTKYIKPIIDDKTQTQLKFNEKTEAFALCLKNNHWVFPPNIPVDFVLENNFTMDETIIFQLINLYTDNDHKLLKISMTNCINSIEKSNLGYENIINECLETYFMGKYIVTAIALTSAIEGLLSKFLTDKGSTKMKQICKQQIETLTASNDSSLEKHVWTTLQVFISQLYEKSDFNSEEPLHLNRHWLLHGRSNFNITKDDCIRLFNTVFSIVYAIDKAT